MMMKIGDVEPWTPRPALYTPGEPSWYALRCAPLKEASAVAWLKDAGASAFYPVKVRKVTVRGKPQERRQTFLPGLVFARFDGEPVWHRLYDHPRRLVRGVLSMADGTPGRLLEADLRNLKALAARDDKREEAERGRLAVKVGDVVRVPVLEDAYGDFPLEVVEVTAAGGIKVRLTLFGRDNIVPVESGYEKVLDRDGLNPMV